MRLSVVVFERHWGFFWFSSRSSPRGRLFLAGLACVGERVAQPPGLTRTIASAVRLPEPVAAVWPGRLAPGLSGFGPAAASCSPRPSSVVGR